MIPSFQKVEGKRSSVIVHYNSLIRTKSFPKVAIMSIKSRSITLSKLKIKKETSYSFKRTSIINAVFSILTIILIFYESELFFSNDFVLNNSIEILRWIIFLCCIFHGTLIFTIYLMPKSKKLPLLDNFYDLFLNKARLKYFAPDFFIVMIHTPPGISAKFSISQLGFSSTISYSDIIFALSLLRIKFLINAIIHYSKDNQAKSQIILSLFKCDNSLKFILKSIIQRYSYSSFTLCFGFAILILGLLLRDFEKHLKLNNIYDFLWIAFATESTVGYGDACPKTHIGRLFAGFGAILGIFIYSYSVMTIRAMTSLSNEELVMTKSLKYKRKLNKVLKPLAAVLIQHLWKHHKSKSKIISVKFREIIKKFKFLRKRFSIDFDSSLKQQISETEKTLNKIFHPINERFRNVNKAVMLSRSFKLTSHEYLSRLRRLTCLSRDFINKKEGSRAAKVNHLNYEKNIMIEGTKALKSLMIKKICNSPVSNASYSSYRMSNYEID